MRIKNYLQKILFKRYSLFRDANGTIVPFKWWWRWSFAYWCLRRWLRYEGMPKEIKKLEKVLEWEKKIANY